MIPFAWNFRTGKLTKKKKQVHGYSRGVWRTAKLHKRTFYSDGNALHLDWSDNYVEMYIYQNLLNGKFKIGACIYKLYFHLIDLE